MIKSSTPNVSPQKSFGELFPEEARAVIAETGTTGPGEKGKVMPVLIKPLQGKADGREINAVMPELLAGVRA